MPKTQQTSGKKLTTEISPTQWPQSDEDKHVLLSFSTF